MHPDRKGKKLGLFNRDHRWTFVFEDFKSSEFPVSGLESKVAFFTMNDDACCDLLESKGILYKIYQYINDIKNPYMYALS